MVALIAVAAYFFFCHLVAKQAESRGRSYLFWFLACVVIDPLVPFVLLMVMD